MNQYGTQLPIDLALQQWRAGTAPAAPYQPDPGLMQPPANPWAEALASNSNVPPGSAPTVTDASSGGGGSSASVPTGPETSPSGGFSTPPEAMGGNRELHLPEQHAGYKPIGGAYANVPQLAGVNQLRLEEHQDEVENGTRQDRKQAATQAALDRIHAGQESDRPAFTQAKTDVVDFGGINPRVVSALMSGGIGTLGVDPGFKQAYDQTVSADERYGKAGAEIARIEGERARQQGEALGKFGEDVGKLHDKYVGDREKIEGSQEAALQDWKKGQEELGAMKIDPSRLFHDGGVPMAITTALGGVLGGILGAMDGSNTNQFMNHLDKMINRDVAAQSAAISKKRADQSDRMNLVGYWRGRLGDTYAAEQAAKASIYDQLKVKTDQLASNSQWGQAAFVGEQIGAQTDLRKAAALQSLANIRQNVAGANFGASANLAAARATTLGKMFDDANKYRPTLEQVRKNNAEVMEGLDNGVKLFVPESMRKDLSGVVSATRAFQAQAERAITEWPKLTKQQRTAVLARLGNAARVVEKAGAYDNGIKDLNQERYGSAKTDIGHSIMSIFGSLNSQEAIADEVAHMREMANQAMRNAGVSYARVEPVVVQGGRTMDYYMPVPYSEAHPDYAGNPRTAVAPTVDNIPQR